jgi:hypothetical protein
MSLARSLLTTVAAQRMTEAVARTRRRLDISRWRHIVFRSDWVR